MSDTEDAQDIKKMADDGFIYQLRKIGPAASCPKVPEMMRLSLGLTRIGRGQHNDYFLDSALLKNFISRSHVEITGKKNENGEIEYVMNDKGLNGTFVNDVRTQKTCILELGDKITFGHTNGYKIEPGSYAEQPKSEFQFIFERVPNSTKTTEVCEDTNHEEPVESPIPDNKKDSGIDRSFLSDLQSNNHVQKSSKSKTSQSVRSRKDSDSMSDSDKVVDTKPKGSKKSGKSETLSKSSVKREELPSKRKSSTGSLNKFSETLPAMKNDDDEEDDDEDDDDKNDDESNDDSKSESESEEEEEVIPKKKRKLPPRKTAPQSTQKKIAPKGKKVIQKDSSSDSDDSSDNESSKPEADQKPKQSQTSSRQKVSTAASATKKKRSSGNTAPVVGSKRKKRKTSSTKTSATASTDVLENLEPGVEWYDEDRCDSADCKRPKKKRTPWVQCDDCDGWYHTVCVGANYNQLKDSDARFNCGCIS